MAPKKAYTTPKKKLQICAYFCCKLPVYTQYIAMLKHPKGIMCTCYSAKLKAKTFNYLSHATLQMGIQGITYIDKQKHTIVSFPYSYITSSG